MKTMDGSGRVRRWIKVLLILLLLGGRGLSVEAQIKLEITEEGGRTLPIAVAPLSPLAGDGSPRLSDEFTGVIARDLDLSGYFQVIDRSPDGGDHEGVTPESIDFQRWADLGALALIKGGFLFEGD